MAITNTGVEIRGKDPKANPIRHVIITFDGDNTYPTGGTPGALQFVKDQIKALDPDYDVSGSPTVKVPPDLGQWVEQAVIYSFQDLDENLVGAAKVVYDRANDKLLLKNRTDDTELAGAPTDHSAKKFRVLIHLT